MAKEKIKKVFVNNPLNPNVANSLLEQVEKTAISAVQIDVDSYKKVATPVADPGAGEVEAETEVELTCATEGAQIYYTLDGEEPDSKATLYTDPIVIEEPLTLKAIAYKGYQNESDVLEAAYTIQA